jgi:CD63 antigen
MLLITVGTTIQTIFGDFSHFLDDNFLSPPTLMVVAGVILLIVALFGCIGALRESTLLINVVSNKPAILRVVYLKKYFCLTFKYAVLLSLIFILQIAAAISAFILRGQVKDMLIRTMNDSLENYVDNKKVAEAVDFMQSNVSSF